MTPKVDTLTTWFNELMDNAKGNLSEFQIFQAGVSKAAANMRARAMNCVEVPGMNLPPNDIVNHIKNKIGQLSDIPE